MVDNIIAAFAHQLRNAEWMDEPTKLSALTKLNSINLFIGYPEWYNNVSALYAYYDGVSRYVSYKYTEHIILLRTCRQWCRNEFL